MAALHAMSQFLAVILIPCAYLCVRDTHSKIDICGLSHDSVNILTFKILGNCEVERSIL